MHGLKGLLAKGIGLVVALGVGCFGSTLHSATAANAPVADPTPAQQAEDLANVPKDAQQYYQGYWFATKKIVNDPLANWKPHSAPWQVCLNESYMGNSWRANLVAELRLLTTQLAKQGLAKPD